MLISTNCIGSFKFNNHTITTTITTTTVPVITQIRDTQTTYIVELVHVYSGHTQVHVDIYTHIDVVDAANVSFVMLGNEYDTTDLKRKKKYENTKKTYLI